MDVSIRKLRVFLSVAQAGSFTQAAQSLHLTSSALSLVIKALEEEVGFKLFDRTSRSVRLTTAGASLVPHAQQLLSNHRYLLQCIQSMGQNAAGVVRVAATQTLSCTVLPRAYSQFNDLWPAIKIVHVDALFHKVHDLLLRGEADLGVGPECACDDDIRSTALFSSQLFAVFSTRHALAEKSHVRWTDLQNEEILVVDRSAIPMMTRDSDYQLLFDKVIDVGHFTTALAMANEMAGVVVCTGYALALTRCYDLVYRPVLAPEAARRVMLFRNRRFAISPAAERLSQHLSRMLPQELEPCAISAGFDQAAGNSASASIARSE